MHLAPADTDTPTKGGRGGAPKTYTPPPPPPEEERLLPEARLDDVCVRRRRRDELHLQRIRFAEDHVLPRRHHRSEALPGDEFDRDDAVVREPHVLPSLEDEVHNLLRVPFREELF